MDDPPDDDANTSSDAMSSTSSDAMSSTSSDAMSSTSSDAMSSTSSDATSTGDPAGGVSPEERPPEQRHRWLAIGALVVGGIAVALWWWWPTLARDGDRTDVLVVGRGQVVQADEAIQRRIREEGMSVEVVHDRGAPCALDDLAATIDDADPSVVVLSPSAGDCTGRWGDVLAAADGRTVVVLVQPGTVDGAALAAIMALDVVVADPTRLLGDDTVTRVGCLWWDDCEPDGQVTVRNPDGTLTDAGAQRLARVLVGAIP